MPKNFTVYDVTKSADAATVAQMKEQGVSAMIVEMPDGIKDADLQGPLADFEKKYTELFFEEKTKLDTAVADYATAAQAGGHPGIQSGTLQMHQLRPIKEMVALVEAAQKHDIKIIPVDHRDTASLTRTVSEIKKAGQQVKSGRRKIEDPAAFLLETWKEHNEQTARAQMTQVSLALGKLEDGGQYAVVIEPQVYRLGKERWREMKECKENIIDDTPMDAPNKGALLVEYASGLKALTQQVIDPLKDPKSLISQAKPSVLLLAVPQDLQQVMTDFVESRQAGQLIGRDIAEVNKTLSTGLSGYKEDVIDRFKVPADLTDLLEVAKRDNMSVVAVGAAVKDTIGDGRYYSGRPDEGAALLKQAREGNKGIIARTKQAMESYPGANLMMVADEGFGLNAEDLGMVAAKDMKQATEVATTTPPPPTEMRIGDTKAMEERVRAMGGAGAARSEPQGPLNIAYTYEFTQFERDGSAKRGAMAFSVVAGRMQKGKFQPAPTSVVIDLPADYQDSINQFLAGKIDKQGFSAQAEVINKRIEQTFGNKKEAALVVLPVMSEHLLQVLEVAKSQGVAVKAVGLSSQEMIAEQKAGRGSGLVEKQEDHVFEQLKHAQDGPYIMIAKTNILLPGRPDQQGSHTLLTRLGEEAGVNIEMRAANPHISSFQEGFRKEFDADKDGSIEIEELRKKMLEMGIRPAVEGASSSVPRSKKPTQLTP